MDDRSSRSAMAPIYLALAIVGYLPPGVPMLRGCAAARLRGCASGASPATADRRPPRAAVCAATSATLGSSVVAASAAAPRTSTGHHIVQEAVTSPLSAWESFYVIVGSSAAALTGLQFVVMALVADSDDMRRSNRDIAAFGSPTVVHFCVALGVAAILSAPWPSLAGPAITLGALGAAGLVYAGIVVRRALRATYRPVLEDWIFHAVLPLIAYAALFVSALGLRTVPRTSLFAIGAASVLLVYVGIHNAWDTVTYIAMRDYAKPQQRGQGAPVADARTDAPAPAAATPPAPV